MNLLWTRIHRFIWSTMIRVIYDQWSWSRSSQRNAPMQMNRWIHSGQGFIGSYKVCSFRRIQKRIFDPRFARFLGRKEREIRNWICNLCNLSPTRAICTTASQKMTCFLLFDKLCDYTVQNLVVGSSNSDDGTYKTDKERMSASLIQFHSSDFFM